MIPDSVYSLLACNMLIVLVLFLVVRPLYERYMIRKIREDVLNRVATVISDLWARIDRKSRKDLEMVKQEIREEIAVDKIIDNEFARKSDDCEDMQVRNGRVKNETIIGNRSK